MPVDGWMIFGKELNVTKMIEVLLLLVVKKYELFLIN